MNEKITNLSPKSSQNFPEQNEDDENWMSKIDAQIRGDPNYFLPKTIPVPPFQEESNWTERKEQKKKDGKETIKKVWTDHAEFVRNSGFRNPQNPSKMLPQFWADEDKNLRLAQILSIPIVKLRDQSYEERLEDWATNVITIFGLLQGLAEE
jgi:hypothetical protein